MDERELSLQRAAAFRGEEILTLIEDGMPSEANLRMEVTIVLPRIKGIKLDFQNKFIYEPSWMQFREEDEKILKQLERMISSYEIGKWLPSQGEARLMRLPETVAEELLDSLRNLPFRIMKENGKTLSVSKIIESSIPVQIECRMTPRGLHLMARLPGQLIPLTENCAFLLNEEQVIATETEQQALLRFLLERQEEGMVMMDFPLQATERVVGEVLPYLKLRSAVEMSEELRKMLVRLPLKARIYLDRDGKSVAARVSFHYGNRELNPFAPVQEKIALEKGEKLLLRFKVFLSGIFKEKVGILGVYHYSHSFLRFGDRKLGSVKTRILLGYKVEIYGKTVGKLTDRNRNTAGTEVVTLLDKFGNLWTSEETLYLTFCGSVTLLNLCAACLDRRFGMYFR